MHNFTPLQLNQLDKSRLVDNRKCITILNLYICTSLKVMAVHYHPHTDFTLQVW